MSEKWREKIIREINSRPDLFSVYSQQSQKLKEHIINNFISISVKAQQTVIELRDRLPIEGLVQTILMSDEQVVDITPLRIHYLKITTPTKTQEYHETVAYLTDRRLMIIDAKRDDIPVMKSTTLPENPSTKAIEIQRKIKDRILFLPISLSDIYNIQLNVSNESITSALLYLQKYTIVGLLGLIFGIVGAIGLWPSMMSIWVLLLGLLIALAGFIYSSPRSRFSPTFVKTERQLGIMAYDPWFKEKSSIEMNVYEDIPLSVLLRWVSEFQSRCPMISQAR